MAYTFEEEQEIAQIKEWWKANYKSLITICILAIAGVLGWNYWQSHKLAKSQANSEAFVKLVENPTSANFDRYFKVPSKDTFYEFALWKQAQTQVNAKQFQNAEKTLIEALNNSSDDQLKIISALRLAMVQIQLKKYDDALNSLKTIQAKAWQSQKLQMEGDVFVAKQDFKTAKEKYQQALANATPSEKTLIQIKLNNL